MPTNPYLYQHSVLCACPTYNPAGGAAIISSGSSLYTNSASAYAAAIFVAPYTGSIDVVRIYVGAKGGTGGTATVSLYSTNDDGSINVEVTANTGYSITVSSNNWQSFSLSNGFNVIAGTRYALVLKNTDAAPATNNYTIATVGLLNQGARQGLSTASYNGSAWTYNSVNIMAALLEYSSPSGAWCGSPYQSVAVCSYGLDASTRGYVEFTTPDVGLNVIGVSGYPYKGGTPKATGNYAINFAGNTYQSEPFITATNVGYYGGPYFMQDLIKIPPRTRISIGIVNAYLNTSNYCSLARSVVYSGYAAKVKIDPNMVVVSGGAAQADCGCFVRLFLDPANPYYIPVNRRTSTGR